MSQRDTFEQILSKIGWIKEVIQKRNWELKQDLILENPAADEEIQIVEKELGVNLPEDYRSGLLLK